VCGNYRNINYVVNHAFRSMYQIVCDLVVVAVLSLLGMVDSRYTDHCSLCSMK
jgi:hypothetical protein